jgi:3-oxoacyl-[acyl-carrier protein] reductase
MTDVRLDGRVAIVTGAARGIGRAIATRLAEAGAAVCLSDRDEAALAAAVDELAGTGARVVGEVADVTVPDDLDRLVATVERWGDGLDVVVANAGRMTAGGIRETDAVAWEEGLRANLTSAFLTCRAAVPALERSGGGRIVLLCSGAAFDPRTVAGLTYAVAKAGVAHLTGLLAVDLAGTNITVNAVAPGAVDTEMARGFGDEVLAGFATRSPLGRIALPSDVADVVLFCICDLGAFVNGQVLRVSGGP